MQVIIERIYRISAHDLKCGKRKIRVSAALRYGIAGIKIAVVLACIIELLGVVLGERKDPVLILHIAQSEQTRKIRHHKRRLPVRKHIIISLFAVNALLIQSVAVHYGIEIRLHLGNMLFRRAGQLGKAVLVHPGYSGVEPV